MLDVLERLLILQDRDRHVQRLRQELANIDPERRMLQERTSSSKAALDAAKLQVNRIETERKELELEVVGKKEQIEKYSLQQFQTKKNEEYRALAKEIDTARRTIAALEDKQLELMEQGEAALKHVASAKKDCDEAQKLADEQIANLNEREASLQRELETLEVDRDQLAAMVDDGVLPRYERLRRNKGESVVVGVNHGVCGGCHMKLPPQVVLSCRGDQEIVCCPNCGRILYYTRDMDLAFVD